VKVIKRYAVDRSTLVESADGAVVMAADLPVEALIYAALLLRLDTGNIESVVNSKTVSEYEREISRLVESARAAQQENKQ
jgi:hypothetical protein